MVKNAELLRAMGLKTARSMANKQTRDQVKESMDDVQGRECRRVGEL